MKNMKRLSIPLLLIVTVISNCSFLSTPQVPTPTVPTTTPSPIPPTLTPQPTNTNTPSPTPLHDSALSFDGKNDYVLVSDNPSLDMKNGFTITAWIYLESYTEWASIVTKGNKPNINNYTIHQSGPNDPTFGTEYGKLRFSGCTELTPPMPESQTVMSLKSWYFVAITFNGFQINYYLNGEPDGSQEIKGPLCTNDEPLHIGVDFPVTTEYWHGAIDELRIWDAPLSGNQIRQVLEGGQTPLEYALVGFWAFDEDGGLIAHDRSKYRNDGVLMGNPEWISPGAPAP